MHDAVTAPLARSCLHGYISRRDVVRLRSLGLPLGLLLVVGLGVLPLSIALLGLGGSLRLGFRLGLVIPSLGSILMMGKRGVGMGGPTQRGSSTGTGMATLTTIMEKSSEKLTCVLKRNRVQLSFKLASIP